MSQAEQPAAEDPQARAQSTPGEAQDPQARAQSTPGEAQRPHATDDSYEFQEWLAAANTQPDLRDPAAHIPAWLRPFAEKAQQGDIHQLLNEPARRVPATGEDGRAPRYSAVLIALAGDSRHQPTAQQPYPPDATVLLTHRAPTMRTHSGQMAFPGGGWETQDPTPIHTALRETWEETALQPQHVTPLATLQPIYIPRTNYAVIPVLAHWHTPQRVFPHSTENDWVDAWPLRRLTDPRNRFTVGFGDWHGPAFAIQNRVLWGFTAGVMDALLRGAGWGQPWEDQPRYDLFDVLQRSANGEPLHDMRLPHNPQRPITGGESTC